MNFEVLPNEILLECFEYLQAFELFQSFDRLNARFSQLIRAIPLHLNFQAIGKSIFEQFRVVLQSNPELINRIDSLKLSNRDTCGQMERFSIERFAYLRSLTLIHIEENQLDKFRAILPSLQRLHSCRILDSKNVDKDLFNCLPMSNLRRLSISTFPTGEQITSLTHVSVSGCSLDQLLSSVFKSAPLLKYLRIENIYKSSPSNSPHYSAVHLKQLMIHNFESLFVEFQILIRLTSNLRSLTISTLDNTDMIRADQWEYSIRSFLPHLKVFHFTFGLYCRGKNRDEIIDNFHQFRTDFWWQEHRWFIEYVYDPNSAVIYTVPYVSNTYRWSLVSGRYTNLSRDDRRRFENVRDLTVCYEARGEKSRDYFPKVTILKLNLSFQEEKKQILGLEYIQSLQILMNFYYLKHLDISSYGTIEPSALMDICQRARQLSSLTINSRILSTLLDDCQLCGYLKTMIKKFDVYKSGSSSFKDCHEIDRFCQTLTNVEQLTCKINQLDQLLILFHRSSKLSMLTVSITSPNDLADWLTDQALRFNFIYRINYSYTSADEPREYITGVSIWVDLERNLH